MDVNALFLSLSSDRGNWDWDDKRRGDADQRQGPVTGRLSRHASLQGRSQETIQRKTRRYGQAQPVSSFFPITSIRR